MWCLKSLMMIIAVSSQLTDIGVCYADCGESRCGRHGPRIRFPFRLKQIDADHCGYRGFDLTCSPQHQTLIEFPTLSPPIKLQINYIDYTNQYVSVSDPENCLPRQLLRLTNSSISPFDFRSISNSITYFFNCPPDKFSCPIHAADSGTILDSALIFCTKMFETMPLSIFLYGYNPVQLELLLWWNKPNCSECEAKGKLCKLDNNVTEDAIQCFDRPLKTIIKIRYAVLGVFGGSIVLVVLLIVLFQIYLYFRIKGKDQARVEKFLQDYRALKPTRFSYADICRITNRFKDKLGEGAHGSVYKGKLSNEILVAVKILNHTTEGDNSTEFINEVGTMAKIHHINVARMLGFCADGFHRALVYDFFPNGSLQKYIVQRDMENFLGWERLQQIALAIAKGIEYLHYGCDHRILHFDINPHNVLLDDNFIPKIIDFGLAKLCSKNQSTVLVTAARGTLGYIAPEVFSRNFGNVSYKSDIYSFGMLLLEMVGGKKNIDMSVGETCQILYPEWIHNFLEGGEMHIHIEDEEHNNIVKKLALIGLWCIQWYPVNRPSIKTVVQMLEGEEGDNLTVPPSPFDSTSSISSSILGRPRNLELEVIHE